MQTEFRLTEKQAEYIRNATHRWNVACGAVRSGKSYCQVSYCIPNRLVERKGLRGLRMILGATRANIERNILQPMRDIYGDGIATSINSQNFAKILGEKVYCIGADNVRQVAKIRGSEIAYCAIDEATDINKEVFEMLKSRLSLPWSCCDATTNPSYPTHFFKEFLDSAANGVDIYCQNYTIYDNPFLPPDYVHNLCKEYAGSVFYQRYILGEWALAEGIIYDMFSLERHVLRTLPETAGDYWVSVDYGTQNPTVFLLWQRERCSNRWICLREYYWSGRKEQRQKTDGDYADDLKQFLGGTRPRAVIVDPSAASFIALLRQQGYAVQTADNAVLDGIRLTGRLLSEGKLAFADVCIQTKAEFQAYVWDDKPGLNGQDRPVKENDHCMDAVRYFVNTVLNRNQVRVGQRPRGL